MCKTKTLQTERFTVKKTAKFISTIKMETFTPINTTVAVIQTSLL